MNYTKEQLLDRVKDELCYKSGGRIVSVLKALRELLIY